MTFQIPSDIASVVTHLTGVGALISAKEWERAAIVYAFTHNPGRGRPHLPRLARENVGNLTINASEFAALGIQGLTVRQTVYIYRSRWADAVASGHAVEVKPGDVVEIPDLPWEAIHASPVKSDESTGLTAALGMSKADTVMFLELAGSSSAQDQIVEAAQDWPQALRERLMATWAVDTGPGGGNGGAGGGGTLSRDERLALWRELGYTESIPLAIKEGQTLLNVTENLEALLWRSGRRLSEVDAKDDMTLILRGTKDRIERLADSCEIVLDRENSE